MRSLTRWRSLSQGCGLVLGLLAASTAYAQDWAGRGRIQGIVTDEAQRPVAGAVVRLVKAGQGGGPPELQTNDKGRWSFLGLSGGTWEVEIEAPGYAISTGSFPVNEYGVNDPIRVQLLKASAVAAAAGGGEAAVDAAKVAEATQRLGEAGRLIEGGKVEEGRKLLYEALPLLDGPKQAAVYLQIARTYYQQGNTASTIEALEKGLAADPGHVESLRLISSVLVSEGRQEEAQPYIARLPAGQKIDPNALLNVGIEKYNANDLDGALAQFDQVVAGYPDLADAYYYRGLVHMGKSNNAQAIADLTRLLELAPDHANAGEAKQFLDYLKSQ
jgi:tetratricopeptide (TPR) repeat protein